MYIVSWLKGHPIISVWVLGLVAFLLYWSGPKNNINSQGEEHNVVIEGSETTKHELQAKLDSSSKKVVVDDSIATAGPFKGNKEIEKDTQPPVNQASKDATTDLSTSSKEDLLLIAREAYWNNGLDEAAEIYQNLIKMEPNVLDHKGELGNVYWRQGFPKKAAELYSEIAIPMIKDGKSESVANMLGFIGLFYPDRAAQIDDHLQAINKK